MRSLTGLVVALVSIIDGLVMAAPRSPLSEDSLSPADPGVNRILERRKVPIPFPPDEEAIVLMPPGPLSVLAVIARRWACTDPCISRSDNCIQDLAAEMDPSTADSSFDSESYTEQCVSECTYKPRLLPGLHCSKYYTTGLNPQQLEAQRKVWHFEARKNRPGHEMDKMPKEDSDTTDTPQSDRDQKIDLMFQGD